MRAHLSRVESVKDRVSSAEWQTRIDLAACYRLVALYGWHDMIYNHISARVPGEEGSFLLNPFGMTYEEITASSLIKVDVDGNTLSDHGAWSTTSLAGFVIHSAIHMGRPDLSCLIHTHTIPGMAISTLQCGLLPLTQSALRFGSVAYHEFEGVAIEMGERERLVRDMGQSNVMILKNHGLIAGGRTIAEAFNNIYRMERAAAVQLQAMACNAPLERIQPDIIESTIGQFKSERAAHQPSSSPNSSPSQMEWRAMLRMLDRRDPSYRE